MREPFGEVGEIIIYVWINILMIVGFPSFIVRLLLTRQTWHERFIVFKGYWNSADRMKQIKIGIDAIDRINKK